MVTAARQPARVADPNNVYSLYRFEPQDTVTVVKADRTVAGSSNQRPASQRTLSTNHRPRLILPMSQLAHGTPRESNHRLINDTGRTHKIATNLSGRPTLLLKLIDSSAVRSPTGTFAILCATKARQSARTITYHRLRRSTPTPRFRTRVPGQPDRRWLSKPAVLKIKPDHRRAGSAPIRLGAGRYLQAKSAYGVSVTKTAIVANWNMFQKNCALSEFQSAASNTGALTARSCLHKEGKGTLRHFVLTRNKCTGH